MGDSGRAAIFSGFGRTAPAASFCSGTVLSGWSDDPFFTLVKVSLRIDVAAFVPGTESVGCNTPPNFAGALLATGAVVPNGVAGTGTAAGRASSNGRDFAASRTFCSS